MNTVTLEEISALYEKYVMETYARADLLFVRGQGSYLYDSTGKEYLDFAAGIAVCSLGHCHPAVTKAIQEQAAKLVHVSNLFLNEWQRVSRRNSSLMDSTAHVSSATAARKPTKRSSSWHGKTVRKKDVAKSSS